MKTSAIIDMKDNEIEMTEGGVVPLIGLGLAIVGLFATGTAIGATIGNSIILRNENTKPK